MSEAINNLGSVRAWLRTCTAFKSTAFFGADFLKDDPEHFALYSVPSALATRENILGDMKLRPVQTQNFIVAYRAPYGAQVVQNLDNVLFFQTIAAWIWKQNETHNFPAWEGGDITSIVPTITPTVMEVGTATARYQIQIKVTYHIKESETNG